MLTIAFPAAAFGTNCYVIAPGEGEECLVVDPGIGIEETLREVLTEHRLKPAAVLLTHGHVDAAQTWRDWLLRAIAGDPERLQIMYSITGDRHLPERELEHLPGYEDSVPVRVGNDARDQLQYDALGLLVEAVSVHLQTGGRLRDDVWDLVRAVTNVVLIAVTGRPILASLRRAARRASSRSAAPTS